MPIVEVVLLVIALLGSGFVFTRLASLVRLPHSVALVIFGILAGALLTYWGWAGADAAADLFPGIILHVLLPPLIFESAYNLDFGDLRRDLVPVTVMAVFGLVLSALVVGWGLYFLLALPLLPSLTFGVLISATDPVAVVALCKDLGVPKRINVLIEGESLLNDGTAIVLFNLMLALTLSPPEGALLPYAAAQFLKVVCGGVAVGLGVSLITSILLRFTARTSSAQLGLTVAAAYLSFIVADHHFHVSGVISTMIVGLYLGSRARLEFSREALYGMHFIWEFLALSANIVVFFGVGITVHPDTILPALALVLPTMVLVYAARAASVAASLWPLNRLRCCEPIDGATQAVLVWGGLRGGLALALVLLLPADFPHKQTFLTLATAVVLSTLFLNALTMKPFLARFGLDRLRPGDHAFLDRTMEHLEQRVFRAMDRLVAAGLLSASVVAARRRLFHEVVDVPPAAGPGVPEAAVQDERFAVKGMLFEEKALYEELLEHGCVSRRAYASLTRGVRERFEVYREGGLDALRAQPCEAVRFGWIERVVEALSLSRSAAMASRLGLILEVHLVRVVVLEDVLDQTEASALRDLLSHWIREIHDRLDQLYRVYPRLGSAIQSYYIANVVSEGAAHLVDQLHASRVLNPAVATRAQARIEAARERLLAVSRRLLRPSLGDRLRAVPVFATLTRGELRGLAGAARSAVFGPGEEIVREGEAGEGLYVLTAGLLEVTGAHIQGVARLFPGDFFGERALLFNLPRNATVTAVHESECLVLEREAVEALFAARPDLREKVYAIAETRK